MSETGTINNGIVTEISFKTKDKWLISYGADPDVGLLWHGIREMDDEERETLRKNLDAAGIAWQMLNLTSIERGDVWTIEEYIQAERERKP